MLEGSNDKIVKSRDEYLNPKQRTSYGNLEGGVLIVIALLPLAILAPVLVIFRKTFFKLAFEHSSSISDRLAYTLKLQTVPALLLQAAILFVLSQRGLIPITRNPLSGHEYMVEKAVRILTNTLEQLVGFELAIFIFAILCQDRFFYLVPALVIVWCTGRLAFAAGYLLHPKYRIPGFVWTFLPTISLAVFNLFKWTLDFDLLALIERVLQTIF